MKLIQKALLCAGLLFIAQGHTANISIYNSNFDALNISDGSSFSHVNNWTKDYGLIGVHNPTSDLFVGEEGEGLHSNTLYMINDAKVSQVLSFKALENTDYKLTFDIGQRFNIKLQNYIVRIKAGSRVLALLDTPVRPSESGTFARHSVLFRSTSQSTELLTLEVETQGAGHAHFDNFELSYARDIRQAKPYLKTVAYGYDRKLAGEPNTPCTLTKSLTSAATSEPYFVPESDGCHCEDSHKVWTGSHRDLWFFGRYEFKNFYECVISSDK